MKKITTSALVASLLIFGAGCTSEQKNDSVEQAQTTNEQKAEDTAMEEQVDDMSEFMTKAASSNMMEIELGKLAQQKAQNADVKRFAQMMVTDHTKASAEMKALAAQKNVTLPDSMGSEHRDHMNKMRDKTGADFDKDYMDMMVNAHQKDVSMFEDASQNMQDPDVKAFASKTLETLRMHHKEAERINDLLKNKNTAARR